MWRYQQSEFAPLHHDHSRSAFCVALNGLDYQKATLHTLIIYCYYILQKANCNRLNFCWLIRTHAMMSCACVASDFLLYIFFKFKRDRALCLQVFN